jgi:hypothetical protein
VLSLTTTHNAHQSKDFQQFNPLPQPENLNSQSQFADEKNSASLGLGQIRKNPLRPPILVGAAGGEVGVAG